MKKFNNWEGEVIRQSILKTLKEWDDANLEAEQNGRRPLFAPGYFQNTVAPDIIYKLQSFTSKRK